MFGEKDNEWSKKDGKYIPVKHSSKYTEAKEQAKKLIESKIYKDLGESDFWILMNRIEKGSDVYMSYTGLIISHNGCLKINDCADNKINPKCFSVEKDGYKGSLVYTYCDDDVYEVGEVSVSNCKNEYPYAMAFKRCFDRVVLKKCKLAYSGIYSDSEADEFTKKEEENDIIDNLAKNEFNITDTPKPEPKASGKSNYISLLEQNTIKGLYKQKNKDISKLLSYYKIDDLAKLTKTQYAEILKMLQKESKEN